jgi:hypothetical protein
MMKTFAACLFLLFFSLIAYAQNDPASQLFIRSVVHEKGIIYTDSIGTLVAKGMKSDFNEQLTSPENKNDSSSWVRSLSLTDAEITYVNDQIGLLSQFKWQPGLFKRATLIHDDSLTEMFKGNILIGWNNFHQRYGKSYYRFSKPIFLRNSSVCFFYLENSCGGLCGRGDFNIYIKRKGVWVLVYNISNWVS